MDTQKFNGIEVNGMLECCLDSRTKRKSLKKKRFKNAYRKVGHTMMESSAKYSIPSKS